jgi:hypothetical protein
VKKHNRQKTQTFEPRTPASELNVPGAENGHTIPNINDDDNNKSNNSKSNYNIK